MTRTLRRPRLAMSHEARPQDQKPRPPMAPGKSNALHPAMDTGASGVIRAQRPGGTPRGKARLAGFGEAALTPAGLTRRGERGSAQEGRGKLGSGEHV